MTLFNRAISAFTTKDPSRVPMAAEGGAQNFGILSGVASGQTAQLGAMTKVGWLFATIDRIASSVAASQWQLLRASPGQEPELVDDHPALDLWNSINPFYTRLEFLETWAQHFELTGEMWAIILKDSRGFPIELMPVRPDRMTPIPDRTNYIKGYRYQIGQERIMLKPDEVIFIRRPSPTNAYRGIGVIQSIITDLESEQAAAAWQRQFFANSAEPGGIIEFTETMSDPDFAKMQKRWGDQHKGTGNAHRVAILEGGKWVDRKFSHREMDFGAFRRWGRDISIGSLGVPLSVMGIVENVNRSNAEAGEVTFSRWTLTPKLRRIQDKLNAQLLPMWGESAKGLRFAFIDPTPANRELDRTEAVEGYREGIMKLNEARGKLGLNPVDDGDEFKPAVEAPTPFALSMATSRAIERNTFPVFPSTGYNVDPTMDYTTLALKDGETPGTDVDRQESVVRSAWTQRLEQERDALIAFVGDHSNPAVEPIGLAGWTSREKLEPSDIDAYDWDWWGKYGDDVIEELTDTYALSLITIVPEMGPGEVQRLAAAWAEHRAARLMRLYGDLNIVTATRNRVAAHVARTIEEGESLGQLQNALRNEFAFSPERSRLIARTETATALGEGGMEAAKIDGRDEHRWVTQADGVVDDVCKANAAASWIAMAQPFPSGHDTVPAHPACRCTNGYRTAAIHEEAATIPEVRCHKCGKLIQKDIPNGLMLYCDRCGVNTVAGAGR